MAEDWQKMQADITADLKKDGVEFVFTRQNQDAEQYDPITGSYLQEPDKLQLEFKAYGILKSLGAGSRAISWIAGTTVEHGDKLLLVDCSTYTPQLEDAVVLYGQAYSVKAISPLEPGIVPLIQYLLLRRA